MPLQTSGSISIGQVRNEQVNTGGFSSSYSLRQLSLNAGRTTSDSLSEFYGYGAVIQNGLSIYLDASLPMAYNQSGTTWTDIKGGHNGTLTNGAYITANAGGGFVFDGVNDYVAGQTNSAYGVTSAITITIWAKAPNLNQRITLFEKYQYPTAPYGYAFELGTEGSLWTRTMRFWAQRDGYYSTDYRGTVQLTNDTIYMFTAVYEPGASIMKMYYNTTEMSATQANPNWFNNANFGNGTNTYTIGGYGPPENIFGACTIYSVMLYNRALSAAEITQNYNATSGRFIGFPT